MGGLGWVWFFDLGKQQKIAKEVRSEVEPTSKSG